MKNTLRAEPGDAPVFEAEEGDGLFVRAAGRPFQVLGAFNYASGPLSLSEISARTGLDRSATQRVVHTLVKLGQLRRGPEGRGYLPGIRILDNTLDLLRLDPIVQKSTPVLLELRKTVRERVDLSLFDQTRLIYALRMQSKRETLFASLVGHSVPMFCTAGGRAALSVLPDAEARKIIEQAPRPAYTPHTITGPDEIMAEVATARRQGYAMVANEFVHGEVAIGIAIWRHEGVPLGAIHVAGSLSEWTPQLFVNRVGPVAIEAARAITTGL